MGTGWLGVGREEFLYQPYEAIVFAVAGLMIRPMIAAGSRMELPAGVNVADGPVPIEEKRHRSPSLRPTVQPPAPESGPVCVEGDRKGEFEL